MAKKLFIDDLKRKVEVDWPPKRIISLVPSISETLYDLGLRDEVVGITRFCIHPKEWHTNKKRVGGTKDFRLDDIASLEPDLVIANKEENNKELLEKLAETTPVWVSDIATIEHAYTLIYDLGQLIDRVHTAEKLLLETKRSWNSISRSTEGLKVLYLIWKEPWMCAGKGTYIDSTLTALGFKNAVRDTRYPTLSIQDISGYEPDVIMLSSEPYPFKDKHIQEIKRHIDLGRVFLVDGEAFSWYGSRMLKSTPIFQEMLNSLSE